MWDEARFETRADVCGGETVIRGTHATLRTILERFAESATIADIRLVRSKQPGRRALIERVGWIFRTCDVDSWPGCFIVATEVKVRENRPATRFRR